MEEEFLGHGIGAGNHHAHQVYPEINLQRVSVGGGYGKHFWGQEDR